MKPEDIIIAPVITEKTYLQKGGKQVKISKKYKDSIEHFMGA